MKLRPLILEEEAKEACGALRTWAEHNPYTLEQVRRRAAGIDPPPGDECRVLLPVGYQVAFSIEQQPLKEPKEGRDFAWVRHLSVSVSNSRKTWPSIPAVVEIGRMLGMKMDLDQCYVYMENDDNDDKPSAVNVVEIDEGAFLNG
jgi:hypothetical protein